MARERQIFIWEGHDAEGTRCSGEISSESLLMARVLLYRQGFRLQRIYRKRYRAGLTGKAVKAADIAVFSRQLASMIKAQVSLLQALEVIAGGASKPPLRTLIITLQQSIAGGSTLAEALAQHPKYFDSLYCNLVTAGEQSGKLDELFERIALHQERNQMLRAKVRKAMIYPAAVIVVALIVSLVLLIKMVPQFESVFAGFGAELPLFTRHVISLSRLFQDHWVALLMSLAIMTFSLKKLYRHSQTMQDWSDRLSLRLPVLGSILRDSAIARFLRTLSITFAAGVPLLDGLTSAAGATQNRQFRDGIQRIRQDIASGQALHVALRNSQCFPDLVVQMTAIGEESGYLDQMLARVAGFHEESVDNRVDALTSLMEPMIMVVVGIQVGGLIIAMYLPMFSLGATV